MSFTQMPARVGSRQTGQVLRRWRGLLVPALGLVAVTAAAPVAAAVTTYSNEASFQSAMDGGFTLVNFDTLGGFAPGYRLDDAAPAAALAALGLDSVGYNAQVVAGQNFQTPTNRDRLVDNGAGFGGLMAFNFTGPVNGLGAYSNNIDYGRIRIFSGANLTGSFLGEVHFGKDFAFGGIASDVVIGSAQFTCDHNSDLKCGVYDIQFGKFAPPPPPTGGVPEPATWGLMILGFGGAGAMLRRRRSGAGRPRSAW